MSSDGQGRDECRVVGTKARIGQRVPIGEHVLIGETEGLVGRFTLSSPEDAEFWRLRAQRWQRQAAQERALRSQHVGTWARLRAWWLS